jgi:carboxyl-terminal processing protease
LGYITGVDTPVIDGSSRAYDGARRKAILTSEIRDASANVMAKHILFVFDSCLAGTAFAARADNDPPATLTPDVVSKLIEKRSRDFITTGRDNEKILANSPMAGFFLAALYGAADRYGSGIISTAQIYQYLRDRVLPLQRLGINLTPQYGKLPPAAFAEGDFLFWVTNPLAPRLTKVDIEKLFGPFDQALEKVRSDYVDTPDETKLFSVAIKEMQTAFPVWQSVSSTKETSQLIPSSANVGKADVDAMYDAGLQILNEFIFDDNDVRVIGAAIKGMLAELDPHSSYLDAKSYSAMRVQTSGEFGGVGMQVNLEGGFIKVVSPFDDSPAARAGVMANDIVTHIDDAPVQGLSLNEAVGKLRGPVNTKVKLTIMRKGRDSPIEMLLTRQIVRAMTVRSRLEGNDVAYIRITRFDAQTDESLRGAINDRAKEAGDKLKGFIIDLRNNPGGLLDQAVLASDAFLESGEIVSTRGRNATKNQSFKAKSGNLTNNKPIIVVINGGTASGSEIMAGALQDHKRATIVGTRSFGQGSIQTIYPLGPGNGAVRLTTARYFTPSGNSIQAKGIVPDIEVLQDVPEELKERPVRSEASLGGHLRV